MVDIFLELILFIIYYIFIHNIPIILTVFVNLFHPTNFVNSKLVESIGINFNLKNHPLQSDDSLHFTIITNISSTILHFSPKSLKFQANIKYTFNLISICIAQFPSIIINFNYSYLK